jgi:hypothetical protein
MTPPDDPHPDLAREFAAHPIPAPTETEWTRVRDAVAARLIPVTPRKPNRWTRVAAIGVSLAACLIAGVVLLRPTPIQVRPSVEPAADPLADYAVLPIATPDDVMVSAVRNGDGLGFVACDHPLPGVIPLVTAADLTVTKGTAGELSLPDPADAPVIMDVDR